MNPWWWLLIAPGILIGVVLLLLTAALLTRTALLVRYNEAGLTLRLRALFVWVTLYPRKEKKKKKVKRQKKKKRVSSPKNGKEKPGLKEELKHTLKEATFRDYIGILTTITGKFIAKFRCESLTVNVAIGGEDADKIALNYGRINGALYPIVGALSAADRLDRCQIEITPDFTSEEFRAEGEAIFSVRLFHALNCILELTKKL